jgi:prophage regulatory protein
MPAQFPDQGSNDAERRKQRQPLTPPPPLDAMPPDAFLRLPGVMMTVGLGRSTLYDRIKLGRFPAPEKLTAHASGWRVRDIRAWLESPTGWGVR